MEKASRDVYEFPDDDCEYPPDLLTRVARFLEAHPRADGLTGRSTYAAGETSNGRFDTQAGLLNRSNAWTCGVKYTIFLRPWNAQDLRFAEELGLGAGTTWTAGESTDYLLNQLDQEVDLLRTRDHHGTSPVRTVSQPKGSTQSVLVWRRHEPCPVKARYASQVQDDMACQTVRRLCCPCWAYAFAEHGTTGTLSGTG